VISSPLNTTHMTPRLTWASSAEAKSKDLMILPLLGGTEHPASATCGKILSSPEIAYLSQIKEYPRCRLITSNLLRF
jgi:hypothetical protein